ncbi:MAG: acetyl-CoA carboxylase biotin carboxyl carrier protein [Planctomycetes bacterium]|nr:acetyl-CoA carboxylase biotin carboxyl carrier protein [Planctomycetota bacterium]
MDIDEIKTLTQLMVDNDLAEIIIRDGEKRVMLRRRGSGVEHMIHAAPLPAAMPQPPAVQAAAAAPAPAAPAPDAGLLKVTSPMVGTYYSSSNPESPPFVRIGDRINPESVVCIIEAMKVFNEIKAEVSGVVESIEIQNGSPVEFGQILLRVRP